MEENIEISWRAIKKYSYQEQEKKYYIDWEVLPKEHKELETIFCWPQEI